MSTLDPAVAARRAPTAVWVAIGLAWAASIAAHATGHRDLLDHERILDGATPSLGAAAVYGAAWVVMVASMMLPSAVPLVRLYAVTGAAQPRARLAFTAFVGGYVAVWTWFGTLALALDSVLHRGVEAVPWLDAHPSLITVGVLALAGAFQFSALKERCLAMCRHPGAYLLVHYRRGIGPALRLGWSHGLFCLGCCWALMLVAFATGMTDLRLMAGFAGLMAYEKIGRHGERVAHVAGLALLATAGVLAISA